MKKRVFLLQSGDVMSSDFLSHQTQFCHPYSQEWYFTARVLPVMMLVWLRVHHGTSLAEWEQQLALQLFFFFSPWNENALADSFLGWEENFRGL